MEISFIIIILFFVFVLWIFLKKENYTTYDTLYQAYTVPYQDMTFISAGERPALGHYLRLYNDEGLSPLRNEYIDKELKADPCNRCMVHCLNPTTLIYGDEALGMCKQFCNKDCKNASLGLLEDAFMESRYQLRHDKNHEHYENIPSSYYDQGGWEDYPPWFQS